MNAIHKAMIMSKTNPQLGKVMKDIPWWVHFAGNAGVTYYVGTKVEEATQNPSKAFMWSFATSLLALTISGYAIPVRTKDVWAGALTGNIVFLLSALGKKTLQRRQELMARK